MQTKKPRLGGTGAISRMEGKDARLVCFIGTARWLRSTKNPRSATSRAGVKSDHRKAYTIIGISADWRPTKKPRKAAKQPRLLRMELSPILYRRPWIDANEKSPGNVSVLPGLFHRVEGSILSRPIDRQAG
jgi:hypothetical protein